MGLTIPLASSERVRNRVWLRTFSITWVDAVTQGSAAPHLPCRFSKEGLAPSSLLENFWDLAEGQDLLGLQQRVLESYAASILVLEVHDVPVLEAGAPPRCSQ